MITVKDFDKAESFPLACKDSYGQLRVGASVGTSPDTDDRVEALVRAGVDVLVVDMPPGTGDIALSLSQLLPLTGAIIVCTPQEVALIDAIKAVGMFRKVKIPVLGLIENMSSFPCPHCGEPMDLFGTGGGKLVADQILHP